MGRAALPILAILVFVGSLAATLAVAGDTLGFDFLAYYQAAVRLLGGQPVYDMSFTQTGGFGLFYYPPTFIPLILPLGLLSAQTATWLWIAGSIAAFVLGVAVLPVSRTVRWWILLLAGTSFPFVYAVKLGQVGPLLFLTLAVGWRWLDEPFRLGLSGAVGAAIKLQPGLVLVWAALTGRWKAVAVGGTALVSLAIVATALAGLTSWSDFIQLVRTVSDPITTEHNFTPGAIAYQMGLARELASAIQIVSTVTVVVAVFVAVLRASDEASYLVVVLASQLVSPILWDHYAVVLLLPVAYLLAAGRWWALAIPLATAWPLVGVTPPIVYPLVFWVTLVATLSVGWRARRPRTPSRLRRSRDAAVRSLDGHRLCRGRDVRRAVLARGPRLRRRPRRLLLPRRRVPARTDVADAPARAQRRDPRRRAVLRAVRPVPGGRPHAARGGGRADAGRSRRSRASTRCSPRRRRDVLVAARADRRGAGSSTACGWWCCYGFSTQILWVTTRGGVWHTGHLVATHPHVRVPDRALGPAARHAWSGCWPARRS